jgi:hypothetical protein
MVGRPQREPEIVDRKNVFQKFRRCEVPNAAGLAASIERMRERVGAHIEIVIVLGFVNAHSPQND